MTSTGSHPTPTRTHHPDRVDAQPWLLAAIVASASVCAAAAGHAAMAAGGRSTALGAGVGVVVALLALLGLPSLSPRLVARLVVLASAGAMVRFGVLTGTLVSGSQVVVGWLVAAVGVFVFTDRLGTDAQPALDGEARRAPRGHPGPPMSGRAQPWRTAGALAAVALAVVLVALVLAPLVLPLAGSSSMSGQGPQAEGTGPAAVAMRGTDQLDMTRRPDLTDDVVFTVTSERSSYWRGETFDRWDGRRWTRSEPDRLLLDPGGRVVSWPDDLGARGDLELVQQVRIEATYADLLVAAPSPVEVDAGRRVAQRVDGTLTTLDQALGRGAAYTVTSRFPTLTEEGLRAADAEAVPERVLRQYAAPPETTERVRAVATEITAGATTTYDQVLAIEAWMADTTEYSLEAPLSPEGVDVVDHFLFESRLGWCEQVASSFVVLARANGIPARLVSGFAPGERDRVTGTHVVRARDAHAWAEVWFPGAGWVTFDPTSGLSVVDPPEPELPIGEWLLDHAVVIAVVAAVGSLVTWAARRLWRRLRAARLARPTTWAAAADRRLVALGDRVDSSRPPSVTATGHARVLAERYGDARLVAVGVAVDDSLYALVPPDAAARRAADGTLDDLEAAEPPPAPADPPGSGRSEGSVAEPASASSSARPDP